MPQATPTHTPNSVVVALQFAATQLPPTQTQPASVSYQDAILRDACRTALSTQEAMARALANGGPISRQTTHAMAPLTLRSRAFTLPGSISSSRPGRCQRSGQAVCVTKPSCWKR